MKSLTVDLVVTGDERAVAAAAVDAVRRGQEARRELISKRRQPRRRSHVGFGIVPWSFPFGHATFAHGALKVVASRTESTRSKCCASLSSLMEPQSLRCEKWSTAKPAATAAFPAGMREFPEGSASGPRAVS
jgi:hypothetical protein